MTLVERAIEKLRRNAGEQRAKTESPAVGSLVGERERTDQPVTPANPSLRIAIDRDALRMAGYMPETAVDRQFADNYRQIKRPLISAAIASGAAAPGSPRLIMMASAMPGDGKTFTSINLALSMARERDISVVLVDSDIPKPHVSRIFGVDQEPGLIDALVDPAIDVETLVLPTDVNGLSVLPSGKPHDGATELLASARMAAVVTRLIAHPRRIVLFDSPPLLASSESRALAAVMGRVVLVVRSGKTPHRAVLEALDQLGPDLPVALVLNQGRAPHSDSYYGYGGHGNYGSEETSA